MRVPLHRPGSSDWCRRLPFVFLNMAITADGKIATANRAISSFGSKRDHEQLLELRATGDAVLAGARTVDSAAVTLGPGSDRFRRKRLRRGLGAANLRVVVSGSGSIDPDAELFKHRFSPVIVLTTARADRKRLERLQRLADEVRICGEEEINFAEAFAWLKQKWKVNRLLCEGGGEVNDAILRAGLVDEVHLTVCPRIFGGTSAPTLADGTGFGQLKLARRFLVRVARRKGNEMFLVLQSVRLRVKTWPAAKSGLGPGPSGHQPE